MSSYHTRSLLQSRTMSLFYNDGWLATNLYHCISTAYHPRE